jgi:hypothetical protein
VLGHAFGDHLPPCLPNQIECQTGMSNRLRKPSVPQICILLPKPVQRHFRKIARPFFAKAKFIGHAGNLNGSRFELASAFPEFGPSKAGKLTAKRGE